MSEKPHDPKAPADKKGQPKSRRADEDAKKAKGPESGPNVSKNR